MQRGKAAQVQHVNSGATTPQQQCRAGLFNSFLFKPAGSAVVGYLASNGVSNASAVAFLASPATVLRGASRTPS